MSGNPMGQCLELINRRFGKLTVLSRDEDNEKPGSYWNCLCDCGETRTIKGAYLTDGQYMSCGCDKNRLISLAKTKHGACYTRFYRIWRGMLTRCKRRGTRRTKNYGDRGIRVAERWEDFERFRADMHESYIRHVKQFGEQNTSIERLNVNGDYTPDNTRWATYQEQNRNRRDNLRITYEGVTKNLSEWAEVLKIDSYVLQMRLGRLKWTVEDAFTRPLRAIKKKHES